MIRRRRPARDGLWRWSARGIERSTVQANPLLVECPHRPCHALAGQPCTTRRRRITGYHPSRTELAEQQQVPRKDTDAPQ